MGDWPLYLSPIAILLSAWLASRNAVNAINASREANQRSIENAAAISRKKNAIDMIMRAHSDGRLHDVYKKIKEMHESCDHDISKFAYKNNNNDCKHITSNDIGYVLNLFEHVANGINQQIFDEETIKRSQFGTITNLYKYCEKFIGIIRDQHVRPTIYIELERLAKKWNEHPLTTKQ